MISARIKYAKKKFQPGYKPKSYSLSRVAKPQAGNKEGAKERGKRRGRGEALAAALEETWGGGEAS